jgi:hypothetical protein
MQNRLPSNPIIVTHSWVPRLFSVFVKVEGITLWPFIFLRGGIDPLLVNHESIHFAQYRELWVLGFFVVYVYDFFRNLFSYGVAGAYKRIRLEVEAYDHEADFIYLDSRKPFAWKG